MSLRGDGRRGHRAARVHHRGEAGSAAALAFHGSSHPRPEGRSHPWRPLRRLEGGPPTEAVERPLADRPAHLGAGPRRPPPSQGEWLMRLAPLTLLLSAAALVAAPADKKPAKEPE